MPIALPFSPPFIRARRLGNAGTPSDQALIPFIRNADKHAAGPAAHRTGFASRNEHAATRADRTRAALEGASIRLSSHSACSLAAPELQELSRESPAVRKLYGLDDPVTANFGRQCLMARRFAEAGVRFVQATHSYKWDQHSELRRDHARNAREVDQPIAALLHDSKRAVARGNAVLWGGEFGRTPVHGTQWRRTRPQSAGLHHVAGRRRTKPGFSFGETMSTAISQSKTRSTFMICTPPCFICWGWTTRNSLSATPGAIFRLTDVHGRVVEEVVG